MRAGHLLAHHAGCTTYISEDYIAKVGHHYDTDMRPTVVMNYLFVF